MCCQPSLSVCFRLLASGHEAVLLDTGRFRIFVEKSPSPWRGAGHGLEEVPLEWQHDNHATGLEGWQPEENALECTKPIT